MSEGLRSSESRILDYSPHLSDPDKVVVHIDEDAKSADILATFQLLQAPGATLFSGVVQLIEIALSQGILDHRNITLPSFTSHNSEQVIAMQTTTFTFGSELTLGIVTRSLADVYGHEAVATQLEEIFTILADGGSYKGMDFNVVQANEFSAAKDASLEWEMLRTTQDYYRGKLE